MIAEQTNTIYQARTASGLAVVRGKEFCMKKLYV